jgi:hypothetical protein
MFCWHRSWMHRLFILLWTFQGPRFHVMTKVYWFSLVRVITPIVNLEDRCIQSSYQMLIIRMQLLLGFVTTFELLSLFLVFVLQTIAQCSQFELSHQGSMDATQTSGQRLIADLRKYSSALFLFTLTSRQCASGTFPSTSNMYHDSIIRLCNWYYL